MAVVATAAVAAAAADLPVPVLYMCITLAMHNWSNHNTPRIHHHIGHDINVYNITYISSTNDEQV